MKKFDLQAPYKPAGDQPKAIKELVGGIKDGLNRQTLLGVTGSGKTASMAFTIQQTQKPALIISHNKTLAAQLTEEFKEFFPNNAVEYFVSYYDYYQPEAYIPRTDTYIAKDASINDEIDRLRHAAMESILTRKDVIVISSVSCIYGLGSPVEYLDARLELSKGDRISRREVIHKLTLLQYERNDTDLSRDKFRVRGDVLDVHPAGEDHIIRVEFFGDEIDRVQRLDSLTGELIEEPEVAVVFPATFFITNPEQKQTAKEKIRTELAERVEQLNKQGKIVEAQRLQQRTTYDLEMLEQLGYVSGIENYSRHMDGREPGQPPSTLIDFFLHSFGRDGFLTFIDESHMTIPQIGAMYGGDAARKKSLIEHGFRLPSAKDNRPLQFHEFEERTGQTIFVSATPADFERNTSEKIVEQIVRPTGLLDPTIEIKPTQHQIDDVISEIKERVKKEQRVLVTTLTKRMAEELSSYLTEMGVKAAYIHSDVDTFARLDILRDLRKGTYDVLVGINLLREGLDLPEVSLIAIMDADKEGYLRSQTALVQIMGRAARHMEGQVIMYADRITGSMKAAIDETQRRRVLQEAYNKKHGITPQSIIKAIRTSMPTGKVKEDEEDIDVEHIPPEEVERAIKELTNKMQLAAQNLDFERAARLRDAITELRKSTKK
ncbi:MAG: excinuclease ABC subunit UvrB [Candidatus Andersenbacteria bacterium]